MTNVEPLLYPGGVFVNSAGNRNRWKTGNLLKKFHLPTFPTQSFIKAIRESGLVGLGGAGFPAHVKLSVPPGKKIDTLIINAAECEPYITSDYREIIENSWNVIGGINTVMEFLDIENVIIGIEDNKPEAIHEMTKVADTSERINIMKLKSRYPQGAEKMLIYATTGRKVPPGKLPADVGVIVMNVNSVSFIAE